MRSLARFLALILLLAGATVSPVSATATAPVRGFGVLLPPGWLTTGGDSSALPPQPWASLDREAPIYVRVTVDQQALENPERSALRLDSLVESNLVPVLLLEPPGGGEAGAGTLPFNLDDWLEAVDVMLQAMGGKPVLVQVMDHPLRRMSDSLYAFLLKRTAVAVRAAAPGSHIASGCLESVTEAEALARWQIGPYVDALVIDAAGADRDSLAAVRRAVPGVSVWISNAAGDGRSYVQAAGLAFSRGVPLVFPAAGHQPEPRDLRAWQKILHPGTVMVAPELHRVEVRAGGEALPREDVMEMEEPGGHRYVAIFAAAPSAGELELRVRGPQVSLAWILDMETGEERMGAVADWLGDQGQPLSLVRLDALQRPLVLRLGRAGASALPEELENVSGQRGLSVAEIIARHREVQAAQERRVRSVEADVAIDFRFSVATLNRTFEVRTLNRLYSDRDNTIYLEKALFLNGARWRGQRAPDLPFVLPERVTEVPLDLTLDRRYSYRLVGSETLGDRETYVVAFAPADDGVDAAYRGQIWIDKETFVKCRMSVVELEAKLPVISNTIQQEFSEVEAAGRTWMLLQRMTGEMVFTALGRSVVLERQLSYSNWEVNQGGFRTRLDETYASSNPILEETADGFRRLEVTGKGDDAVRTRVSDLGRTGVSRLLVGVWSIGENLNVGIPFAGVNYFNFDWRGTGTQFDVVWAGPFANVIWSDPSMFDSKNIITLEARINPIYGTNRRLDWADGGEGEVSNQRLEESQQRFGAILGRPLGPYHKLELKVDFDYLRFRSTDGFDGTFTIPNNTWQETFTGSWLYTQAGWRLESAIQAGVRDKWDFWGTADGSDYDPEDKNFIKGFVALNRSWFAARRNNYGFRLGLYNGDQLDRFSMFELGGANVASLPGYSGSGLRFHKGASLDLNGTVALTSKVSMDMTLSHARFYNEEDFGPDLQHATAARVGFNFAGPFNALMRVRLGASLGTSVDDADGGYGLRVTYFRTFRRWFWQKKPQPATPAAGK